MPYYTNPIHSGAGLISANPDGYSIKVQWSRALPNIKGNKIAYNIYYSENQNTVFDEAPKFISITGNLHANIRDLTPGQLYHFAVRALEYNPLLVDPSVLPVAYDNLRIPPESILTQYISPSDLIVPLLDTTPFPGNGLIQVGVELISYVANDTVNNNLIVQGGPAPQDAGLVLQPDGYFYTAGSSNTGQGVLNNLSCVSTTAPAEVWTIKCVFCQRDTFGNSIAGTAKFEAFGFLSKGLYDGYGEPFVWDVFNDVLSNGILSFSIQETSPAFVPGDYFTVQVLGAIAGSSGRGYNGTPITGHYPDGWDGYHRWSPYVSYFLGIEEQNAIIFPCQNRFDVYHDQLTIVGGYHNVEKDYLTTDLEASDRSNVNFRAYDYAGWRRTDPVSLLNGDAVGSYFGGEQFCADGYEGTGRMLRGLSFQERNDQRQEYLLSLTGEPVCLFKRQWTGITCDCYLPSSEYPDDRCEKCYGTKFVVGWEQYFNPRRSDGRIMVRYSPVEDDLKPMEAGLESELNADVWTLTVPTIKDRDFIVRFNQDGTEEFRYEVLNVNRNRTLNQLSGAQKFRVQRVRKFDPIYSVPVFHNTQYFPRKLNTTLTFTVGIPEHSHEIVIDERTKSIRDINQLTGIAFGHTHPIRNGIVQETLHHKHEIILPKRG